MVQGFTPQQQQAFQTVQNAQGIGVPYLNAAAQEFGQATTPLWPTLPQFGEATLDQYMSPYTKNVTSALQNLYNQQNATQQAQVQGNATARGAYGGDREAVAQALTAQQEQLAQAPTLANVQQQGYQTALSEFNQQQQAQLAAEQANAWLSSQAGFGLAGLGSQAQNQALSGATAELGTGGLQQQLGQEQLNIPYEQFVQQQAYPYQQLNFLEGLTTGAGSLAGGTGSTTSPGPSALSQIAGLGLAGAGLVGATGGFGSNGWLGGLFGGGGDAGGTFSSADSALANDAGLASDLNAASFTKAGGRIPHAGGGRIGFAPGGSLGSPVVSDTVPDVSLSFIPPAAANPGFVKGLDTTSQTQNTTGSGGGNALGAAAGAIGLGANLAKLGALIFAKDGGRAHYDAGGGLGSLPTPPAINLDWLVNPGPNVKQGARGSGPPQPPRAQDTSQNTGILGGTPAQDLAAIGSLKKLGAFGDDTQNSAAGGRIGYQAGGGLDQPLSAVAPLSDMMAPNAQSLYQQFTAMPLEKLQEYAARVPPTSAQGRMIQRALQAKLMTPGAGTAPTGQGIGGQGAPGQAPAQGIGGNPPQQGMAEGGTPGYVTEDELDPHPVVDHSGDTVVVRYPSEGKTLDLGIPSMKERGRFTAGGSAGGVGASPVIGSGGAASFFSTFAAPNGVQLPQLSSDLFAGPGAGGNPAVASGGGLGNWFNPLPQFSPAGAQVTAASSAAPSSLPAVAANTADLSIPTPALLAALGPFIAKRGGRIGLAEGGDTDDTTASAPLPPREPPAHARIPSPPLDLSDVVEDPGRTVATTLPPDSGLGQPQGRIGTDIRGAPAPKPAPAGTDTVGAGSSVIPDYLQPLYQKIKGGESGGRNVLYGPGSVPVPPGNVIPGAIGPTGQQTHAFSEFQFEPDTWNHANQALTAWLGRPLDKNDQADRERAALYIGREDYRNRTHGGDLDADAKAGKVNQSALAGTWTSLREPGSAWSPDRALRAGLGMIGADTGIGTGGIGEPSPQAGGLGRAGTGITAQDIRDLMPAKEAARSDWTQSPWFPVVAAGLGMMASRSPFPGVAIGEGGLQGVKAAETASQLGYRGELADTRAQALVNQAANTAEKTRIAQDALGVRQSLGEQNIYLRQSLGAENAGIRQQMADVAAQRATAAIANAASLDDARREKNKLTDDLNELKKNTTTTQFGHQDYNDPNSPTGIWAFPHVFDPSKPNGGATFYPGVGAPKAATGQQVIYQELIKSGAAKDEADAIRVAAQAHANPDQFKKSAEFARLAEQEAVRLHTVWGSNLNNMGKPEPKWDAQAQQNVLARINAAPGAAAPTSVAPQTAPTPASAPAAAASPAAPKPPDQATATAGARAAIAAHPDRRDAIVAQMRAWGYDPAGLP